MGHAPKPPGTTSDEQAREIARLRDEVARLERDRRSWERERERLRRENAHLKDQLDAARRAGFRQAAPFSKGTSPRTPRRPGRRPGVAYGVRARRRVPTQVDETHQAALPPTCACGGAIIETATATQYQEELPAARVVTRAFTVHIGHCAACGRRVQGRHPLQTSDALGAAAAHLGPQAVALAAVLNKQLGLSFGKVATLLRQHAGLPVTRGGLVLAVHRAARAATPTYAMLRATVRGSPVVAPDETGWKVGGHLQWLWTAATPDTTVYAIQPGRGFDEAAALLGADFSGVLVRDGWAPYRRFTHAIHQTCLAHLLRRGRHLCGDHPGAALPRDVQALLHAALALRTRRDRGVVSLHGVAVARGRLVAQLNRRLDAPGRVPAVQRYAAHLVTEFPAIFTFLLDPMIEATNWRAEQAIRPAVVTRKTCGGNRTWRGADTQQTLASVIRTACQRHVDPHAVLVDLLRAPTPIVSPLLQLPGQ